MKERMVDYVEASAAKFSNKSAYEFMGKATTYPQFVKQIDDAARALLAIGVKENDIICVSMPNMPQAIILIYAANKIGATVNMIHPLSSEEEIAGFVNRVQAKTILVLDQFYKTIEKIRKNTCLEHVIVAGVAEVLDPLKKIGYCLTQGRKIQRPVYENGVVSWSQFLQGGKNTTLPDRTTDCRHQAALILHSGGTTGKVKGVCLSNFNVNSSAHQMVEANPMINASDRFLSVMPIFHGNGLVIGIHAMMMVGASCILIPRFTPETYAKDLLKNRCNYMSGVPALFERLMTVDCMKNADLSFLKGVFSGADYLSVELERKINEFLKAHHSPVMVRQGYGMTEGVVATTLNPPDFQKEGSIGKALPGVKVKIVAPGTEEEVPVGETGEIVFSSDTNMMYYHNDPEETNIAMHKHADGDFWIHSGDLGSVDSDGFFFFKGRIKRMIVTNGYNVFPNELENTIEGFEMVNRCCVLGVARSEGTQKIKAFIVLNNGVEKSEETKQEIMTLCRKAIAKYALPREIEFIDEMPKTKVGKVDFNALLKKEPVAAGK